MNISVTENQLIDYLNGALDAQTTEQIRKAIEQSEILQQELEALQILHSKVVGMELEQPPLELHTNFIEMLEQEKELIKQDKKVIQLSWRNVASIAAVLLIGVLIGIQFNQQSSSSQIAQIREELALTKDQVSSLMQQESTAKRIKAVNMTSQFNKVDEEMLDQLVYVIHNDKSINVRLAAVEALKEIGENATAKNAFVSALRVEEKPIVQIALIHALVDINAQNATSVFDEIIEEETVLDKVKDEARLAKFKLL
ncbi:MAG: HEAT repeat domain-containing protein [Bacteroidota bacterium]